ncbi:hypothetical protein ABB37_00338 [Leptomonas pyrrhocoris]|uniref:Uncharacterized protein n=1 Tax=Leptomonas pyrrhocoris TaxID=157538 RepID=A0A0N0E061_LEPPY|nr:hypothetical protein ABB37_00338 [Leptomonas pyrrhocoris]KPA86071.1 hypothetical protein ABB37_00338 [Leptomonas pyrrhocoris]|eukprot:XP_015664510.1 hypothetical protein ABB37_00338 [Leptomonas pyrrhocoris]
MTGLTQQCPSDIQKINCSTHNAVQRRWLLRTLDPSLGAAGRFSENDAVSSQQNVGDLLANIMALLYRYLVNYTDAATRNGCRTVFVELVVFVFAGWELLLFADDAHQPTRQYLPQRSSPLPAQTHAPVLLGEGNALSFSIGRDKSYDDAAQRESHILDLVETNGEAGVFLSPIHYSAIFQAVSKVAGCFIDVIIELTSLPNAGEAPRDGDEQQQRQWRYFVAASLLRKVVRQSPLFRRVMRIYGHVCAVVRRALPSFIELAERGLSPHARKRRRDGGSVVGSDTAAGESHSSLALHLLLEAISTVLFEQKDHPAPQYRTDMHFIASPTSWNASAPSDGTILLSSLTRLLKLPLLPPRLTPLVLTMLREFLRLPETRKGLLQWSCGDIITTAASADHREPQEEAELLQGEGTELLTHYAGSPSPRLPVDLAVILAPLLLHHTGEVVGLTCAVVTVLLDGPITDDRSVAAASCAASVAVARHVENYVVHAVETTTNETRDLCAALVNLLELVATILEAAEAATAVEAEEEEEQAALCGTFSSLACQRPSDKGAVMRADAMQRGSDMSARWRVVFHVAHIDMRLFEQLVCGAVFRRATRSPRIWHPDGPQGMVKDDDADRGVDWNSVVAYAISSLLDRPLEVVAAAAAAAPPTATAPALTLFAYLCFLNALATSMGAAVQAIWPNNLMRVVNAITERVDKKCAGTAVVGSADALVPLSRVLQPRTHLLLIRVVAAFLPYTKTALHHVALLLLNDLVHSHGLASARSSELMVRSTFHWATASETEEEAECRCLLSIATHLFQSHNALTGSSRWSSDGVNSGNETCPCCRYHDACEGSAAKEFAFLHRLCAPPPEITARNLLDVLLGLHPESTLLLDARASFVQTIMGHAPLLTPLSDAGAEAADRMHGGDPLAFISVTTVAQLVEVADVDVKAELLLGLSNWVRASCVGEGTVKGIVKEAVEFLVDQAGEAVQRVSGASTGISEKSNDRLALLKFHHENDSDEGDEIDGVASSSHASVKHESVCRALQRLLSVVAVCLRWYGAAPDDERISFALRGSGDHISAVDGNEVLRLRALMLYAEESFTFRHGLCHFLFAVASRHHVNVHRLLVFLNRRCGYPRSQAANDHPLLFPGLGAVVMLGVLLHLSEVEANSTEAKQAPKDPFIDFLHDTAASHWLTSIFTARCDAEEEENLTSTPRVNNVCCGDLHFDIPCDWMGPLALAVFPGQLLLASLFRCARAADAYRTASSDEEIEGIETPQSRESSLLPDDFHDEGTGATVSGLDYIFTEAQHQVQQHRRSSQLAGKASDPTLLRAGSVRYTAESRRLFFKSLLSQHLTPFIAASLRAPATPSVRVAATDPCTAHILRLACISLWFLTSTEASECDAVLTQYALRHVRLCLCLTEAEVKNSYVAVSNSGKESAADGDGGGAGRVARVRGLPRLSLLVLQLLYLLLMRSNRSAVATADRDAIVMFLSAAKDASASAGAWSKEGNVEVHVMAAMVEVHMRRLPDERSLCANEAESLWCDYINLLAFRKQPSNFIGSVAHRRRVWVLLAGVEGVLRLHPGRKSPVFLNDSASVLGACSDRSPPRGDVDDAERVPVLLLFDWCHDILIPAASTTTFFAEPHNNDLMASEEAPEVMVVAARIVYLLLHRCPSLIAAQGGLDDFLDSYCSGVAAVSDHHSFPSPQHLVAEGWVLAALLGVVLCFPHWHVHVRTMELQVVCFLRRPEVSQLLQRPEAAPDGLSLAAPSRPGVVTDELKGEVAGGDAPLPSLELRLVVLTLIDVIRTYERRVARNGRLSPISRGPLLPVGSYVPSAPAVDHVSSTRWWTPYAIPTTERSSKEGIPLLLIFNQLLC